MFYALQREVGLGKGVDDNVRPRVVQKPPPHGQESVPSGFFTVFLIQEHLASGTKWAICTADPLMVCKCFSFQVTPGSEEWRLICMVKSSTFFFFLTSVYQSNISAEHRLPTQCYYSYFNPVPPLCEIRYYYYSYFSDEGTEPYRVQITSSRPDSSNWENQNSNPGLFYTRVRVKSHKNSLGQQHPRMVIYQKILACHPQ